MGRPKALVPLSGRPMLQWSVDALRAVAEVDQIVVALPADALGDAPPGTLGVAGGQARSESVRAALAASAGGDPVIVHDAARPLAPPELFRAVLAEVLNPGVDAVVAAAPVADTIKEVPPGGRTVARTLDRSGLWAIQTPQAFRRAALESALSQSAETLAAATDDAWLIERAGGTVHVLPWTTPNFKVTAPVDLRLAELLLESA
jgi:2-C-methyl-D-erythritol 4-phosphate cytidylyltransferase